MVGEARGGVGSDMRFLALSVTNLFLDATTTGGNEEAEVHEQDFQQQLQIKGDQICGSRTREARRFFSINRLQFFSRLETHGFAWRNGNLGAGTGIASNASFARAHIEYSKSPQFNALTMSERLLHAFEDSFHRQLGFGFGDAGSCYYFVDDVELNHEELPDAVSGRYLK
jgi:hypothetical protein